MNENREEFRCKITRRIERRPYDCQSRVYLYKAFIPALSVCFNGSYVSSDEDFMQLIENVFMSFFVGHIILNYEIVLLCI